MRDDITLTRHAQVRMQQRGLRDGDLRLLLDSGSQIADDALLLTEQDAAREIERRKQEIQRLERLKGVKVIFQGSAVITCYRPSPDGQKAALRRSRVFRR